MQTAILTVAELPASEAGRYDSTLYNIATADGLEMGCGTADEIRAMVADEILPADLRLSVIWTPRKAA